MSFISLYNVHHMTIHAKDKLCLCVCVCACVCACVNLWVLGMGWFRTGTCNMRRAMHAHLHHTHKCMLAHTCTLACTQTYVQT